MLIEILDDEAKKRENKLKEICSHSRFRKVSPKGEVILCSEFRGINPSLQELFYSNLSFVWLGETCPATEFNKKANGKYVASIDVEKMKTCPYCTSSKK
jgi:hypothetical protein